MATSTDTTLLFFSKATPAQWSYVYSHYKDAIKAKASKRTKKGGPDELIRMDNWYQEQLPKIILSRKEPHITHEELIQITKWKLMRGRYRPNITDLVRINTEKAVITSSKKAFQRLPNLSGAVGALTCLKGVGPATASAILAAGFPLQAPFMADECMISTPGVETLDYTIAEYLNYTTELKKLAEQLNKLDPNASWDPHKIELALWAHFVLSQMNTEILNDLPLPSAGPQHSDDDEEDDDDDDEEDDEENNDKHPKKDSADNNSGSRIRHKADQDEDSIESHDNPSSVEASNSDDSNSRSSLGKNGPKIGAEPPAKKSRK